MVIGVRESTESCKDVKDSVFTLILFNKKFNDRGKTLFDSPIVTEFEPLSDRPLKGIRFENVI